MDDILRGLTGEAFTLVVGPSSDQLTVQRGVLEKIPYFQGALNGDFKENSTETFRFSDFDPKAVADVIFYSFAGRVDASIEELNCFMNAKVLDTVKHHAKTYIVADAWGAEAIGNALCDELVRYHRQFFIHPELLTLLSVADLCDSPLYKYLLHQIASDCLRGSFECDMFDRVTSALSREDMGTVLSVVAQVRRKAPLKQQFILTREQCACHSHACTKRCEWKPDQNTKGVGIQGF